MKRADPHLYEACDRESIRKKVIDALKAVGHDEGAMRQDEWFVLDTEEGRLEIPIEIVVYLDQDPAILIKCVRGNLSTRERASLSLARLLYEKPIPFAIVANEADAVVFDTTTGKAVGQGYRVFPDRSSAEKRLRECSEVVLSPVQEDRERRILSAYYHLRCTTDQEPF